MAFTAEDGTGLAAANSYIDVATADAYFTDRSIAEWTGADAVKQAALIKATDYIEKRFGSRFKGIRLNPTVQALGWPRTKVYDREGYLMDAMPVALQQATAEYALRALSAPLQADPSIPSSGRLVVSESSKVGPVSEAITYQQGTSSFIINKPYPAADTLLRDLITPGNTVIRG